MTNTLLILCTCENQTEARHIARALVHERLAACANIIGGVQSIFRWNGEVSESEEVQLLIKTSTDRYPAVENRILELHSYDTPEILAVPIAGSEKYLAWLREQL